MRRFIQQVPVTKMSENNMTVAEASRLMGVSQQFIRVGLQKGIFPFGYAVQISAERFTYFISRQKFSEYTGIRKNKEDEGL